MPNACRFSERPGPLAEPSVLQRRLAAAIGLCYFSGKLRETGSTRQACMRLFVATGPCASAQHQPERSSLHSRRTQRASLSTSVVVGARDQLRKRVPRRVPSRAASFDCCCHMSHLPPPVTQSLLPPPHAPLLHDTRLSPPLLFPPAGVKGHGEGARSWPDSDSDASAPANRFLAVTAAAVPLAELEQTERHKVWRGRRGISGPPGRGQAKDPPPSSMLRERRRPLHPSPIPPPSLTK